MFPVNSAAGDVVIQQGMLLLFLGHVTKLQ